MAATVIGAQGCRIAARIASARIDSPAVERAEIPYRSQFASPDLVDAIVNRGRPVSDDPRWRESGASTPEEYVLRASTGCGMACLQMVLAAHGRAVPGLTELWRRCETYGGYRPDGRGGLIYAGLVAFADAELGIRARVAAPLPLGELIATVAGDEVVIASVHKYIRRADPPVARGGHLVLVTDAVDGRVCFHNPSGDTPATRRNVWMDAERFGGFYAERGIAIELPRDGAAP